MNKTELYQDAYRYFSGYSSTTELRYPVLMQLKHNVGIFASAIVLMKENPNITAKNLCDQLCFKFTEEHLELLANYHLRDILQDRSKIFNKSNGAYSILSSRQLYRRLHRESKPLE